MFLHQIVEGGSDKSYGIEVAKLAGLPGEVIHKAQHLLDDLEKGVVDTTIRKKAGTGRSDANQLDMFANQRNFAVEVLKEIDIDTMTPIEALNKISELKQQLDE